CPVDDFRMIMSEQSYSFRSSVIAPECQYFLTADRLTWANGKSGISYRDIVQVKVYQRRFWGSSRLYWTCKLYPYRGRTIFLSAAHRLSFRTIEDRSRLYIPFIKNLESRIAASNKSARFVISRGWLSWVESVAGGAAVQILRLAWRLDLKRSTDLIA